MPIKAKDTALGMRAEMANVVVGTVLPGLTAAGTNQATAYVLTLDDNHVFTTVAAGTGCVFRSTYAPGDTVRIANFGANPLNVYPASGGTINTGSADAPVQIIPGWNGNFTAITATTWFAITGANGTVAGGTVTSVAMTGDDTVYNAIVPGSPITSAGTLAPTLHTQSANTVLAGPTSGGAVAPTFRALISGDIPTNQKIAGIVFIIDGGGATIITTVGGPTKGYIQVPFGCTIQEVTLLADQSGSIVINIWKCTYAQFDAGSTHPVAGDSIDASTPPTLSSAVKYDDNTLSGWTTTINSGDILAYNVSGTPVNVQRVTVTFKVTKV